MMRYDIAYIPPPVAQAWPRSQKSRQNNDSTPTTCVDKAVHVRDTHDRKAHTRLNPYTEWWNPKATFQMLPVLIHCRGLQVPGKIEALSNLPPHLEHACPSGLVLEQVSREVEGITMLGMAQIHIKQTAWSCHVWYNLDMNRMHNHRHD